MNMSTVGSRCTEQAGRESAKLCAPSADTPIVRCERLESERFGAGFTLRLASSVAGAQAGADLPTYDNFLLEHALAALDPGQQVRFVFRSHSTRVGLAQVTFDLHGQAVDADSDAAETSATALYDTLARLLAARSDCRFLPVEDSVVDFSHRFQVEGEGVLLTAQTKPAAATKAPASVILPALSLVEARVPFWDALLGCSFPVEVSVAARPVQLDEQQLKAVADALGMLGDTRLRYEHFPERCPLPREQVRPLNAWFEQELERWLKLAVGVQFDVEFATQEPVSPGALRWLAQTLLPTRRLKVRRRKQTLLHDTIAVDLRMCLNEAKVMPALLPDREAVRQLGLPLSFPPPQAPLAKTGIVLGEAADRNVRLPAADRDRHCYVVGATGCGKSTLLCNLILQDIAAGEGVCLIDPHGDLYREVLQSIPRQRAHEVILLDPTEYERAVGLNYLEIPGEYPAIERNFVTNEMMKIFDRLYDMRHVGGPMFETYARFGLLLLMENRISGLTLVEFPLIFESDEYRERLVENCTNPSVARFWSRLAKQASGDSSLENMAPYVTSKFNQFAGNVLVRNIVGQSRSTIDFRGAMDQRRILLVNLSKGLLGEFDAALLGMLIVSKLFVAAMGRARIDRKTRWPFNLYIDEFQNFTTDTVAHLLSEARKFGLRLTLANQHLTQIDVGHGAANLSAAVLGNVGTLLAMRVGAADANALQGVLGPQLDARTLQNLPDYHVAARLLQGGRAVTPFVFKTLAPAASQVDAHVQQIIHREYLSVYTRPVQAVEKEIDMRSQLVS
ncbi:MAG: type IV secretion system DNA-binding domain-containing protein [Fimbriimonadaceae bacterium]|nr:type IV secretion system DNA-binding domain-containing protein [Fimbriimonadaceae bacterium]